MRIVVKLGSNVLVRPDGRLSIARMAELTDEVSALCTAGHQVLLVSSGAVATGKAQVSLPPTVDRVARRQVLSAVGQSILVGTYRTLFAANGLDAGQILLTRADFATAQNAANIRQCIQAFFAYGIVPVVNENDPVSAEQVKSVEAYMFTDNDELAGLIAHLIDADLLVLLTSVDGLYDGDPASPTARLIREVSPSEDLSHYVADAKTSAGRGGMETKLRTAMTAARDGITAVIASGLRHGILGSVVSGADTPCTRFLPAQKA